MMKILYIDDSKPQLDAVQARLTAEGYSVMTASDPKAASQLVAGRDIVILDFHMPGMNGAELLASLTKKVPTGGNVLFYLYTSDPEIAVNYKKYGFDGAFTRKGSLDDLLSQIRATLRVLQLRRFVGQSRR